jgi:peptidoglycan/xylan/chitin deacetylase (PgdA/CDA1 family)
MQWLKKNGYCGVTLSAGLAMLDSENKKQKSTIGKQPCAIGNSQPVVLTFDDGFHDFYTSAFPLLQEFGFAATMYLPTAFIGNTHRQFTPAPGRGKGSGRMVSSTPDSQLSTDRECLTWNEVREMHAAGIEFGSHTVNHPELVNLPWPEIESEIRNSKSEIENRLGVPCTTFAYPYAFPQTRRNFVIRLKDLLVTTGYETCVTTQIGRHRPDKDPLQIRRLPVNSDDDEKLFLAKLGGSYDWLQWPQGLIKKFKRPARGSKFKHGDSNFASQPGSGIQSQEAGIKPSAATGQP